MRWLLIGVGVACWAFGRRPRKLSRREVFERALDAVTDHLGVDKPKFDLRNPSPVCNQIAGAYPISPEYPKGVIAVCLDHPVFKMPERALLAVAIAVVSHELRHVLGATDEDVCDRFSGSILRRMGHDPTCILEYFRRLREDYGRHWEIRRPDVFLQGWMHPELV